MEVPLSESCCWASGCCSGSLAASPPPRHADRRSAAPPSWRQRWPDRPRARAPRVADQGQRLRKDGRVTKLSRHCARPTFALVTGGGTAGHVQPALAVAEALVARGHAPETIGFVGSRRGIEGTLVPEAGFEVTLLPGRGIQRRLTLENVGAIAGLLAASVQALAIVARRRPSVVVTVGGYAGLPCA